MSDIHKALEMIRKNQDRNKNEILKIGKPYTKINSYSKEKSLPQIASAANKNVNAFKNDEK